MIVHINDPVPGKITIVGKDDKLITGNSQNKIPVDRLSVMNKIHNMDCFEFMKQIPDDYFDLVLTDPPYNITQNKWDVKIDLELWWSEINRISKKHTAKIVFSCQPFTTDLIVQNRKQFRYTMVWDKVLPTGFLNANKMPLRVHEDICIFYEKLPLYNVIKTQGHDRKIVKHRSSFKQTNYGDFKDVGGYDSTERHATSILTFSNGGNRSSIQHPTQKDLELVSHLLRMYSTDNFKVFDPFMGSGTTAIACKSLGLDWCGCELEADYVEMANKRLEKVQGALF